MGGLPVVMCGGRVFNFTRSLNFSLREVYARESHFKCNNKVCFLLPDIHSAALIKSLEIVRWIHYCARAHAAGFFFFFFFHVSTGKTLHSKFCCAHQFINERTSAGGFYLRRGGSSGTRVQFESPPYLHRTLPARRPASHRASGKCAEQFLSQFSRASSCRKWAGRR